MELSALVVLDFTTQSNTNHHIRHLSSHSSGSLLLPEAGDSYKNELMEYNRAYPPVDEWEGTTHLMSLNNVVKELKQNKGYILYSRVTQNGILKDKKLCYSYCNCQRRIILLVHSDIMEIRKEKRQKRLLQDALNAVQVVNQAKDIFPPRMSCDTRTPMNTTIRLIAIAVSRADDPDRAIDCLGKIISSSKLLLSLTNEVLDMSKIESGRIVLSEENFPLDSLSKDTISMIQPDLKHRGHILNIHIETLEHEAVRGDMQRLQQIIDNPLSNAIRHTPHDGTTTPELSETRSPRQGHSTYRLICEDNGVGISPELIEHALEPLERAEDRRTRSVRGTDLDMAITRSIAGMIDGGIWAESAPGRGFRLTVALNLRPRSQILPDSSALTELPVLMVSDDRTVCKETCQCLDQIGMNSSPVISGKGAVPRVVSAHRDLRGFFTAIVDLYMPDMNGTEIARRICAQVGCHVSIIAISAYDTAEHEAVAKEVETNGLIPKSLFLSKFTYMLRRSAPHEEEEAVAAPFPGLSSVDLSRKRILLAEGNPPNQEITVAFLQSAGTHVETVMDDREAVEMFAASFTGYYNLISMNIQMPHMGDYQATRRIRATGRSDVASTLITVMTVNVSTEDTKLAPEAGMNQHMAKPTDIRQLEIIILCWLG